MSWVKLDDAFPSHPKVLALSIPARWAHIVGLCYAAKYLTDGFVPAGVVKLPLARELEKSGLWRQDGAGWWIHDYLEYNPSKQESEELVNKRRKAGRASAEARLGTSVQQDVLMGNGSGVGVGGLAVRGESAREGLAPTDDFDRFFAEFPTARKGARRPTLTAWKKALTRADAATIIQATIRYRDDPNRFDEFTKGAAAWLNADGWEWGPQPQRTNGQVVRKRDDFAGRALKAAAERGDFDA